MTAMRVTVALGGRFDKSIFTWRGFCWKSSRWVDLLVMQGALLHASLPYVASSYARQAVALLHVIA